MEANFTDKQRKNRERGGKSVERILPVSGIIEHKYQLPIKVVIISYRNILLRE